MMELASIEAQRRGSPWYAARVRLPEGSVKRDLAGLRSRRDVISLAGGHPDTSIFDEETLKETAAAFVRQSAYALQYGPSGGTGATKQVIREVMAAEEILADTQNLCVVGGAQQGLDLMGRVFLEEGNTVLVETPTYYGALDTFRAYRPRLLPIPMDREGMDVQAAKSALEGAHQAGSPAKFTYTIPNFHNPTGATMLLDRRRELLDLAREYGTLILEDNPYGLLRYEGEPLPTMAALDMEENGGSPERVMYLGTFSKIFAPGVQLGWAHARQDILEKVKIAKKGTDLGPSNLSQVVTTAYFEGDWQGYLERMRRSYLIRREAMLDALAEFMPEGISWTRPDGGFFVLVSLPKRLDAAAMLPGAVNRGVAYVPGEDFSPDRGGRNQLRLSFSFAEPQLVRRGVQLLAEVVLTSQEHS